MKGTLTKYLVYSTVCFLFGCHSDDGTVPDISPSYGWTKSSLSPANAIDVFKFKKGEDGQLYMLGWPMDGVSIFAKLVDKEWETIAQVDEFVIGDFAVYNDTVYYSTSRAVKKARGVFVDTLLETGAHCAIESFQGRVFIAGAHISYNGGDYGLLSFDATNKVTPLYEDWSGSSATVANHKIFIGGASNMPLLVYDKNGFLEESSYRPIKKKMLNIDSEETIYSIEQTADRTNIVTKFNNTNIEQLGNPILTSMENPRFRFFADSFIVSGQDTERDATNVFFLTDSQLWKSIRTDFVIYDLIDYNDKILAGCNGEIKELQLEE